MPLLATRPVTIVCDLERALRAESADEELLWQAEGAQPESTEACEFVNIRAVFVGDEDAEAVVRHTYAFRIEPPIARVAGSAIGIEVIGAAGEIVEQPPVLWWGAGTYTEAVSRSINERRKAAEQTCRGELRIDGKWKRSSGICLEVHAHGMKASDVADRVVNGRIKADCIGAAIGKCKEFIAGNMRQP